jgi:hypothetical protein
MHRRAGRLPVARRSTQERSSDVRRDLVKIRDVVTQEAVAGEAVQATCNTLPLRVGDPPVLEFDREQVDRSTNTWAGKPRTINHVGTSIGFRPGPGVFHHRRGHSLR